MSRHLIDQNRDEMPVDIVERYLKIERKGSDTSPPALFAALSRKPRQGWGHVDHYLKVERGRGA